MAANIIEKLQLVRQDAIACVKQNVQCTKLNTIQINIDITPTMFALSIVNDTLYYKNISISIDENYEAIIDDTIYEIDIDDLSLDELWAILIHIHIQ